MSHIYERISFKEQENDIEIITTLTNNAESWKGTIKSVNDYINDRRYDLNAKLTDKTGELHIKSYNIPTISRISPDIKNGPVIMASLWSILTKYGSKPVSIRSQVLFTYDLKSLRIRPVYGPMKFDLHINSKHQNLITKVLDNALQSYINT